MDPNKGSDPALQHLDQFVSSVFSIWRMISEAPTRNQANLDKLFKLLESDNQEILILACNYLSKLLAKKENHTLFVFDQSIPPLIKILRTQTYLPLLESVCSCLRFLVVPHQASISQQGGVACFLQLLTHESQSIVLNASLCLSKLSRLPSNRKIILKIGPAPLLALLRTSNEEILKNVSGCLWESCSDMPEHKLDRISRKGGIDAFVPLLSHPNETVLVNSVGCFWKLVNNTENRAAVGKRGIKKPRGFLNLFVAITPLVKLLSHDNERILERACACLSNLASNNTDNKLAMSQQGLNSSKYSLPYSFRPRSSYKATESPKSKYCTQCMWLFMEFGGLWKK